MCPLLVEIIYLKARPPAVLLIYLKAIVFKSSRGTSRKGKRGLGSQSIERSTFTRTAAKHATEPCGIVLATHHFVHLERRRNAAEDERPGYWLFQSRGILSEVPRRKAEEGDAGYIHRWDRCTTAQSIENRTRK